MTMIMVMMMMMMMMIVMLTRVAYINLYLFYLLQEHDEPILKHLLDIRVIFTGPDSNVDTTQYPQPTPMVCYYF